MSLISPNFDVKRSFFPNCGEGPFTKIAGKSPDLELVKQYVQLIKRSSRYSIIKAYIRLHRYTGWSAPLLLA